MTAIATRTPFDDVQLRALIAPLHGLYYGQLSRYERNLVEDAIDRGFARRNWDCPAGFLGLSKVEIL